jgi:hypothetical protein
MANIKCGIFAGAGSIHQDNKQTFLYLLCGISGWEEMEENLI